MLDSRPVIKEKADGVVKARLCAKDFAHTKRDDLCVPTPSPAIVRTLLTRTHRRGWDTCLEDFVQAFLHAPIDDDKVILRPLGSVRRHLRSFTIGGESVCFPWIEEDGWTSCVFSARREGRRVCDSHRRLASSQVRQHRLQRSNKCSKERWP